MAASPTPVKREGEPVYDMGNGTVATILRPSASLGALAKAINAGHQQAVKLAGQALEQARQVGLLLLQAKAQLRHGEWLPWLRANLAFTPRRAQQYMAIGKCEEASHSELGDRWRAINGHAAPAFDLRSIPDRVLDREWARRKRLRLARTAKLWERRRRREAERARKELPDDDLGVVHGRFQDVAETIPDNSVDLCIADPVYTRKSVPIYYDLGAVAARVLVPGGSLICYVGGVQLPEALDRLGEHLRFWWSIAVRHAGTPTVLPDRGVNARWKQMLWLTKGSRRDRSIFIDDLIESRQEKQLHPWQQSTIEAEHLINALTAPGDLVLDPMTGSGTVPCAAKRLGRKWLGIDSDEDAVAIARKRLHDTDPDPV
jgi:hypothetical protein